MEREDGLYALQPYRAGEAALRVGHESVRVPYRAYHPLALHGRLRTELRVVAVHAAEPVVEDSKLEPEGSAAVLVENGMPMLYMRVRAGLQK